SRRGFARLYRPRARRLPGARRPCPRNRRRQAAFDPARRRIRRRGQICKVARPSRRRRLQRLPRAEPLVQPCAPKARLSLLVALGLSQEQGQERGRVRLELRDGGGARGATARCRRRGLRPYPQGRDARHRWRALLQRWRLGRELHGTRGASLRPTRNHRLDPNQAARPLPGGGVVQVLVVTDAWYPQVNGVVRTLDTIATILRRQGHPVHLLTPQGFATLPCPTYPEIRLSLFPSRRVAEVLDKYAAGAIHIATEGPLGIAARRICLRRGLP